MKENKKDIEKTPSSIYLMHKYWGKKPSDELKKLVEKYTKEGDLILDPFAGYGGIGIEGILLNRDVIINDLNPIANFIAKCIMERDIDLNKLEKLFLEIKEKYSKYEKKWYSYENNEIITTLRDKNDRPKKIKIKDRKTKKMLEIELRQEEIENFIIEEEKTPIKFWYPTDVLIKNSRINSNGNMRISDLFPKRALICQAYLFEIISNLEESKEKEMLKLAFTSNLANCSKLVPPITSRGETSQGAWMTGYYIGEYYLENNVFHYFENRVKKIIKGKSDYLDILKIKENTGEYTIKNYDAKEIDIRSNSIDFVFTDFPYGDTIPYFEQSQLWNTWLRNRVDYENEIVVSDSSERQKDIEVFSRDITKAISEISRVLKENAYFVFTFHSLYGKEWTTISNAIAKNDFKFVDCELMLQKTLPPRQLNRKTTIKGDILVVYKKCNNCKTEEEIADMNNEIILELREKCGINELYDTNEIITMCVRILLEKNKVCNKVDFIDIIKENFEIDENNKEKWRMKQ